MAYTPFPLTRLYRGLASLGLIIAMMVCKPVDAESQALRALANNTFSGTVNGAILGGATMALTNSDDFGPVRFGVGLGTLAGMGVGIYDATNNFGMVHGTFNTASKSGYIILMDTIYGAATGTVVGVAVSLIANNRITLGAQYGIGAGAWAGFTFGLVDAFYLSRHTGHIDYFSINEINNQSFLQWNTSQQTKVDFFNPAIYAFPGIYQNTFTIDTHLGVEVAKVSLHF